MAHSLLSLHSQDTSASQLTANDHDTDDNSSAIQPFQAQFVEDDGSELAHQGQANDGNDSHRAHPFEAQYAPNDDLDLDDADDDDVGLLLGDDDDDGLFTPTQRFQLEHVAGASRVGTAHGASNSDPQSILLQSSQLSAQDYIPKKLVGYEYGDKPWQLKPSKNPILDREVFLRIGTNTIFECRPSVIKFSGYEIGKHYTTTLSIVNVSKVSQRLHILPPSEEKDSFKITFNKLGTIAPGMCETVTIHFEPTQWRYYHTALKIHCLGENLLVPVHAYPTLNDENYIFPAHIQMVNTYVGHRSSRRIELKSTRPIQFEYELTPVQQNEDYMVFPLRGIIPANGSTFITIDYCPRRAITSTLQLRVNLAQFDFKPFVATITGHASVKQLSRPVVDEAYQAKLKKSKEIRAKKERIMNRYTNSPNKAQTTANLPSSSYAIQPSSESNSLSSTLRTALNPNKPSPFTSTTRTGPDGFNFTRNLAITKTR